MSWWGKIAGGGLGFAMGGPLGALLGAVLGHQVDKASKTNFDANSQERTQAAFFTATFSVMGHIAKVDGHVSPQEIHMAEQVFRQMNFNSGQRSAAIELFNQGKSDDFDLDEVLDQFRRECGRKISLIQMFMQIQLQAVYADGRKHPAEERVLKIICDRLRYPVAMLAQLEALLFAQQHQYKSAGDRPATQSELENAYAVLGIKESATDDEVKRAYRKLMHQNHPDKLISKGLPEEMIKVATEKSKLIQKAYDVIKKSRKFS
jgi:DnaJ like chaperone protein